MKKLFPFALAATLSLTSTAFAQRGKPPTPAANPAPASAPAPSSQSSSSLVSTSGGGDDIWKDAENILNNDSLSADTENGIFQWKGTKFDISNNLVMRQEFERYLSLPGNGDSAQEYANIIKKIHDDLSVDDSDPTKGDKVYEAWKLLFDAAKYDQDAKDSETLANMVYDAWRVRDEMEKNTNEYNKLDHTMKGQTDVVVNDTTIAAHDAEEQQKEDGVRNANNLARANANQGGSRGGPSSSGSTSGNSSSSANNGSFSVGTNGISGSGGTSSGGSGGDPSSSLPSLPDANGATKGTYDGFELARTFAKENAIDAATAGMGLQVKLQYQTQLLTFVVQRRFQHSLIAGQFYEHIFKGSQQRVTVGQKMIAQFTNIDNFVPSVNSFEFLSREAIADTDTTMKAVENAYDSGQRWTALQQLQRAFLLGEYLPSVQGFDPAKRQALLAIYHEGIDLKHMMDMHDLGNAETTIKKMQVDAPDFDAASVLSAIQEGKQTSNLALMSAQKAALDGDNDRMDDSLQTAIKLWPMNPAIDAFSKSAIAQTTLMGQGAPKFDELLEQKDERQIYNLRTKLGLALYQDPDRSAKLMEIVNRVGRVDMLISVADQTMKQNNGYAAWELLAEAAKLAPNDPVLAHAELDVAKHVDNFVTALDSADNALKAGDYASSLNYYLQAQDIYQGSKLATDGIDLTSKKLMAKLNPTGPTARSLAVAAATGGTTPSSSVMPDASSTPANNITPASSSSNGSSSGSSASPSSSSSSSLF